MRRDCPASSRGVLHPCQPAAGAARRHHPVGSRRALSPAALARIEANQRFTAMLALAPAAPQPGRFFASRRPWQQPPSSGRSCWNAAARHVNSGAPSVAARAAVVEEAAPAAAEPAAAHRVAAAAARVPAADDSGPAWFRCVKTGWSGIATALPYRPGRLFKAPWPQPTPLAPRPRTRPSRCFLPLPHPHHMPSFLAPCASQH